MKSPLRFIIILIFLSALSGLCTPAHGQAGGMVISSTPDVSQFPAIRFHLDVTDADGNFVPNLQPADLQIVENGANLMPEKVETVENGLQLIFAVNPGPALAVQVNGISEYQRHIQALLDWVRSQPAQSLDDYSLSTPTGLFLIRAQDPKKLEQALAEFTPDLQKSQPSLNSISQALDLATDPLNQPLMKRSILYITQELPVSSAATLPDLAVRAKEIGVRVNVWLVGPAAAAQDAPEPLEQFAQETGGKFYRVLPTAPLPEIEALFQPLRQNYLVQYQSKTQKSGAQTIQVETTLPALTLQSAELRFDLDVQPPNPIFLDPPNEILRTLEQPAQENASAILAPDTIPLKILVEFPDAHPRSLQATRLYADGELVAENTSEPFDRFTWSIAGLTVSQRSVLRVEAVDKLNLSGSSIEIPVDILVEQPAQVTLFDRFSETGIIAISAMVIAGSALALILARTNTQREARWKRQQAEKKLEKDPLTQPVLVQQVAQRQKRTGFWKKAEIEIHSVPFWPRSSAPNAAARLIALDESEQPVTGGLIPLSRQEITFGSDPKRATQVLNSPTVDSLHARLYRTPEGKYILADQDSIAGTWINYAPVTASGAHLEHGDLIHIGKVMFRFELTDSSQVQPAEIKVDNLEQPHDPQ